MESNILEGKNPGDKASSVTQLIQSTFPRLKKNIKWKKIESNKKHPVS